MYSPPANPRGSAGGNTPGAPHDRARPLAVLAAPLADPPEGHASGHSAAPLGAA